MIEYLSQFSVLFWISQIVVFFAIISDILTFQFKDRKKVLLLQVLSTALITLHYFFLGENNAGFLLFICTLSFLVSAFSSNKKWMIMFFIIYPLPLLLNYTNIFDIMVFVGLYIILFSTFQKNDQHIRIGFMISSILFITYNIIVFTPMGVVLELIFFGSNIVGYWKHYIKKKT